MDEAERYKTVKDIVARLFASTDARDALLKLLPSEMLDQHYVHLAQRIVDGYERGYPDAAVLSVLISVVDWTERRDREDATTHWLREARAAIALQTGDRRRVAWRAYAAAAYFRHDESDAALTADELLSEEEKRFGKIE